MSHPLIELQANACAVLHLGENYTPHMLHEVDTYVPVMLQALLSCATEEATPRLSRDVLQLVLMLRSIQRCANSALAKSIACTHGRS